MRDCSCPRVIQAAFGLALLSLCPTIEAVSTAVPQEMHWLKMTVWLIFGLVLFLFGMAEMEKSLSLVAGDSMKSWLEKFTDNRIKGLVTGGVTTAIIQSSSVTTALLVSLVSAEFLTFARAIPVILGANIGTTFTAQLIAFKITHTAPYLCAGGYIVAMSMKDKNAKLSGLGSIFFGLGLLFFGMSLMSDAMRPLRDYQPFMDLMVQMSNPLYGMAIAAVFTALVQSSSATMGMVVVMATQGLISIEAGIALALGANIGTCITAIIASIGKTRQAVRVAVAHIIFNIGGALIFISLIPYLAQFVEGIGDDISRQVANAHTTFNVIVAFIFLPFTSKLADLTVRLLPSVPEVPEAMVAVIEPKYLVSTKELKGPLGCQLGMEGARLEIVRMGSRVQAILKDSIHAVLEGEKKDLDRIRDLHNDVGLLNTLILDNIMTILTTSSPSGEERESLGELLKYPPLIKSVSDRVKTNMLKEGDKRIDGEIEISGHTKKALIKLHGAVMAQYGSLIKSIDRMRDVRTAEDIKNIEKQLRSIVRSKDKVNKLATHITENLVSAREQGYETDLRIAAYQIETEIIRHLLSIHLVIRRMAKVKVRRFIAPIEAESDRDEEELES